MARPPAQRAAREGTPTSAPGGEAHAEALAAEYERAAGSGFEEVRNVGLGFRVSGILKTQAAEVLCRARVLGAGGGYGKEVVSASL